MLICMREIVMSKVGSNEAETSAHSSVVTDLKEQLFRNPLGHDQAITTSSSDPGRSGNGEVMAGLAQRGRDGLDVQASAGDVFILGVVVAHGC